VQFFERGIWTQPLLPVFGSPWQVPFEFPLFQASAATLMGFGGSADFSNRLACLIWFCVTAALIFWIARRYAGVGAAWASLLVFTFSPFAVQWGRTAMIEYCATALALAWIGALFRWRTDRRWHWGALALMSGSLAFLVKPTTALPLMIPAVLFTPPGSTKRRQDPVLAALLVIPVIAGVLWTFYADHIKASNDLTAWLTSGELRDWTIGTLDQRLDPANLALIVGRLDQTLVGALGVIAIGVAIVASRTNRLLWLSFAMSVPFGIGVFFNLYVVHDYYLAALSPALALCIGVGTAVAVRRLRLNSRVRSTALAGVVAVWLAFMSWYGRDYRALSEMAVAPGIEVAEVTEHSSSSEQILIAGADWSPVIPYYAGRKALMLRTPSVPGTSGPYDSYAEARDRVGDLEDLDKYTLLFAANPDSEEIEFAAVRPWYAAVGPRTVRLGDTPDEVAVAGVLGTSDAAWLDAAFSTTVPSSTASTLACDGAARYEVAASDGPRALRTTVSGAGRILVSDGLAPLPVRAGLLVRSHTAPVSLRCLGGGSVTLQG